VQIQCPTTRNSRSTRSCRLMGTGSGETLRAHHGRTSIVLKRPVSRRPISGRRVSSLSRERLSVAAPFGPVRRGRCVKRVISTRMSAGRIRLFLAATAVGAVLAYGLSDHGVAQMSHDDMAGAAVGLCLLLVTALPSLALPKPQAGDHAVVADAVPNHVASPTIRELNARARASPAVLQRFRN
jgi:hypothetical protein